MDVVKRADSMETQEETVERLVKTYQLPLKRMCCVWLRDTALAEDAVQETFLKACAGLPDFRGACSEKTWLTKIALHVCRDLRRGRWFRHVDRGVEIENLSQASVPAEEGDDSLFQAVCSLPQRQREAVMLYYYQDMNLTEIGEALHVAASTVQRRLEAARKTLRRQLEEGEA